MADVSGFDPVSAARNLAEAFFYRYHNSTKHTVDKLLSGDHYLDWKNQPDPFRLYSGADVKELSRAINEGSERYFELIPASKKAVHERSADAELISNLLFYSTAISAWKQVRNSDNRWALRVNASSGNLHPTETHLAVHNIHGIARGVYHYSVRDHSLECRAEGEHARQIWALAGNSIDSCPPMLVCFTSVLWRECWKYRQRGFRYCQHDMGHALGALMVAADSLGWSTKPFAIFPDEEVARLLGVFGTDECPALIIGLQPSGQSQESGHSGSTASSGSTGDSVDTASGVDFQPGAFKGTPNKLSSEIIEYEIVDRAQKACCLTAEQVAGIREKLKANGHARSLFIDARPATLVACEEEDISARLDLPYARMKAIDEPAHKTIRRRRSAVDMDGRKRMSLAVLSCILASTTRGFDADFARALSITPAQTNEDCGAYLIDLFVYAHRVDDLQPGLYFFDRPRQELVPLALADQRENAKFISCFQDIAADGCFALSMVADLARANYLFGDRGYKLAHYEGGVIGQLLYLASAALGYDSTGIGCFIDDAINKYLVLPEGTEVVYNFTVGGAVNDARLTTLPSYDFAQ